MIKETEEVQAALKENEVQLKLKHLNTIATELGNLAYLRVIAGELSNISYALDNIVSYLERQDTAEVEEDAEVVEEEEAE